MRVVGGRVDKCLFPPPLWGGLGSSAVASGSEGQAADVCSSQMLDSEWGSDRAGRGAGNWDSSCKVTGLILKEFLPEGTIARGIGVRSGRVWKFFDSNHAQSRGSWISGWSCQKSGPSPH